MKAIAAMCESAVHCMVSTRVNTCLVAHYSHTTEGRGPGVHEQRSELSRIGVALPSEIKLVIALLADIMP
jgi:hypothetical protein